MEGIRDFINNQGAILYFTTSPHPRRGQLIEKSAARVYSGKADSKGQIVNEVVVRQLDFITKALIPLLDSAN